MADDIENSEGFDPNAPRLANELLENETFRNLVAARHLQFFGDANPPDSAMYTHRGMLASEATKQLKLAQLAALMGRTYVAPTRAVAAPSIKAQGLNPLAAMARRMADDPKAVPSAAPKI
eukprot:3926303-Heterocapsa_arctica.AAC.1